MKTCKDCGKLFAAHRKVRRCMACRVAAAMQTFRYTPDPYAVAEYRQNERLEPREVRA
jgi:hypothetical protein